MSRGLRMPVGVNRLGGTAVVESDKQASKVVLLALSDNDSDNAFQQGIGLGTSAVFSIRSPSFRALVTLRLKDIFEAFERLHLYRLDQTSLKWSTDEPGDQVLEFTYINLESDEPISFSKAFKAGA